VNVDLPYCSRVGDYSRESPRLRYAKGGRLVQLSFSASPAQEWNGEMFYDRNKPRSVCKGFSKSSRRRLMNHLNSVSCDAPLPLFVTLTFPDSEYDPCITTFVKKAKRLRDVWLKRLERICPSASAFWKMEQETRKSGPCEGKVFPHFHLMIWGLEYREALGRCSKDGLPAREAFVRVRDEQLNLDLFSTIRGVVEVKSKQAARGCFTPERAARSVKHRLEFPDGDVIEAEGIKRSVLNRLDEAKLRLVAPSAFQGPYAPQYMSFFDWASLSWYHVVGSHDVNHFLAGVSCEAVRTWGGVRSYCSKYLAKLGDWEFMSDVPLGRQWGIFNRALIPWAQIVEVNLDNEVGNRLRRICRRYLDRVTGRRHHFPFGVTLYCDTRFISSFLGPP